MHVVVAGDIGGAERLLVDLASRPDATRASHSIALVTPNRALAAYFASAGLTVYDRGPSRDDPLAYLLRSLGPRDVGWLAGLLHEQKIDVVHTHTFASHVIGTRAAQRAGLPQLRTEHHVMHYFDPSCSPFTRWAAARTERVVAVSEYVRSIVSRTAPAVAARTAVVRNGVDTSYWSPRPRGAGQPFRVGVVCRLTGWKRVHLAVEAAALAGVDLLVVGDGEERARLESLVRRRHANAHFVGHVSDPRPLIADCDVILSAADREPLGLSVLEALAMERPVIAFAGGGIPEIVKDGVTGWLVEQASAASFAAAIDRARSDPRRRIEMAAEARRFVVREGHLDAMCAGYAVQYQDLRRAP
jgi:glycosyltransferase involved in cell wall biosynthesis